jgi:hypothetical protein
MDDELTDSELAALISTNSSTAIAMCVEGLGCTVWAGGKALPPWADEKAAELVGIYTRNSAIVTTKSTTQYFLLNYDENREEFSVARGPLGGAEVRAVLDTQLCECGHPKSSHYDGSTDYRSELRDRRPGDIGAGSHKGETRCKACEFMNVPVKCYKFRLVK